MEFLMALIVGGFAGWLASMVTHCSLGILGNIIVGFLGGLIASLLFGTGSNLSHPTLLSFLFTVLGAVILLVIVNLFTRKHV